MDRVKLIEARRAKLALLEKRYTDAELILSTTQPELMQKTEHVKSLEEKLKLATQKKQLVKDLTKTLDKLNKAKTEMAAATGRLERAEAKVNSLREEADMYESRYQTTKKEYKAFMAMMDSLEL